MKTTHFYIRLSSAINLLRYLILALCVTPSCVRAQCDTTLMYDDYSDSSLWVQAITVPGCITFTGNKLNYINTHASNYERVLRPLPDTLPDMYWNATCKFTPFSGNGVGHYVMAFTAGTLDPISYNGSYALTNQDAIMVYYIFQGAAPSSSTCCTNPTVGPWQMAIRSKKGTLLSAPSPGISVLNMGQPVYVRLERLSADRISLHVYSDSTMTMDLPGSPVYSCIDSAITGLNTLQQGVITWGSHYRTINAEIDDLNVCIANHQQQQSAPTCADTTTVLQAYQIQSASYTWAAPVVCSNCQQVTVPIPSSGAVTYSVQIGTGCGVINETFVVAKSDTCNDNNTPGNSGGITCEEQPIPNVFTPNGDKQNDEFIIHSCKGEGNLEIFNRWGELIFKQEHAVTCTWNGKIMNSGADAPDGVYFFILTGSRQKNGYVMLLR